MKTIKEKMWLWGHDRGSHDNCAIPMKSKMTPLEGAIYLGTPNMCRVVYGGKPEPPFEQDALALDCLNSVVWSIIGDSSSARNNDGGADIDAVAELAKRHKNIIGGIMDDFLNPSRINMYAPSSLADFKRDLTAKSGREMQLWTVVYTHELNEIIIPYLKECDVATLWTWESKNLINLEANFKEFRNYWDDGKPLLGGCYLWDYGGGAKPMPMDLLKYQMDFYYNLLKTGGLDGVVFCSNNVCDVGLESVEYIKNWIKENGDEICC